LLTERHQQHNGKVLHEVSETVHSYNPSNGWLQSAIPHPIQLLVLKVRKRGLFTLYGTGWRKFRGGKCSRLLSKGEKYTLDKVIADGYDTKLSIFEVLILPSF
jgi:hypothetical protein